ncbi:MAG: ABC transporter permease, partial [Planctomycetaceae bacterium]
LGGPHVEGFNDGFHQRFDAVAPALVVEGSLERTTERDVRRAGQVNVFGLDERGWAMTNHGGVERPTGDEIVLSNRAARSLVGDERDPRELEGRTVTLTIELPSAIPGDTLLGRRDLAVAEREFTVRAVLDEASGVGRLQFNPNQNLPQNAFVAVSTLQGMLGLEELTPTPRNPEAQRARVNTLLVSAKEPYRTGERADEAAEWLTQHLPSQLTWEDLDLRLVENERYGYLSLESERQILEPAFAEAAFEAADKLDLRTSPVMVYLANRIEKIETSEPGRAGPDRGDTPRLGNKENFSKYSIVAGIPATPLPQEPPFGPYEFVGEEVKQLGPQEILINDWLAEDLNAEVGDKVRIRYHVVGSHGELPEEEVTFTVAGIVKLDGTIAADRRLTPEVEGITDADDFADWDAPFPMDLPVTDRDDAYWETYRTAPKAFIRLDAAQELWRSRYGELTSIRIARNQKPGISEDTGFLKDAFFKSLDPAQAGLAFRPVKAQGLSAASGTTDFAGLFIGFSFFLILSAAILIALLFRLGIERRGTQLGLLSAVGFSPRSVRRLFLTEG